ncbi:MAG: ankyrin repeat domain-containing protein [Candidatus Symbiodolus clandestinus]
MFTNKFYLLAPVRKKSINDGSEKKIAYNPAIHGKNIAEFKRCPDFKEFKKQYGQLIDQLINFLKSDDEVLKNNLKKFHINLFSADFCDKNPGILWNSARESLDGILELLKNSGITLNKRKDAVAQLANDLTVCAEGCVSKIEAVYLDLQLELLSNDEFFQKQKELLIGQFIIDFVRDNKKSWHSGMDVHFVNAYYNAMASDFGLAPRNHEQTVTVTHISEQDIKKCLQFIQNSINPKYLVSQLTTQLISEIEDVLVPFKQQQKISFDLFQDDISIKAIDAILARANKRYHSSLNLHDFLVSDDDNSYKIIQDHRMLQLIVANGLKAQQLFEPQKPVLVAQSRTGDLYYSWFDQWCWRETTDGEKTFIPATELEKRIKAFKKHPGYSALISSLTEELITQSTVPQLKNLPLSFFSIGSNFLELADKLETAALTDYLKHQNLDTFKLTFSNQYGLYHFINKMPKIALILIEKTGFFNEKNQYCSFNQSLATQFFIDMMLPDNFRKFSFSETRFQVLTKAGADINVKNKFGRSLLSYAAEAFSPVVGRLLILNADANLQDNKGNTPLMYAVSKKQQQIVEQLINHNNINLSAKNFEGKTALDLAKIAGGNILILIEKALLNNEIKNIHNNPDPVASILGICHELGDQVVADYFSKHLLSPDSMLANFKIILPTESVLFNFFNGYPNTFATLKQKIIINNLDDPILFNTEMVNRFWLRSIETMNAAQKILGKYKYLEILKTLIDLGADVNQISSDGRTLLMKAAISGNLKIVILLLKQSTININIIDKNQQNALMLAARENQREVVERLLMRPEVNLQQVDIKGNNTYLLTPKSNATLRDLIVSHSKMPAIEDTFYMVEQEDTEENFEVIDAENFAELGNLRQDYNSFNENEEFGFVVVNQQAGAVLDPNPIHLN